MLTDMQCVENILNGDGRHFDVLVRRYQQHVMSLIFKHVRNQEAARDLTQDVFFKVYRKLKNFKGESKFSSWLYRIAVNESIDYLRKQKRQSEDSLQTILEKGLEPRDQSDSADIHGIHARKMEIKRVRKALSGITPEMRSLIVLKVYEEKTFDQIAEILDVPLSTVKSRLYRALSELGRNYRRRSVIREVK
ncbi:MAG: hypothetical protein CR997_04380 [Acidobacteria bacterium]|nr:MAG: hypothetical protein CR997_04380 [Acidobacteriota bacterium]